MEVPCDDADRLLFANCTQITLGNGNNTNFWGSSWLHGQRPMDVALLLFAKTRQKKKCSVASAFEHNKWMWDLNLRDGFDAMLLTQFVTLWNLVSTTILRPKQEDKIIWT
jgi:hypothetical protein